MSTARKLISRPSPFRSLKPPVKCPVKLYRTTARSFTIKSCPVASLAAAGAESTHAAMSCSSIYESNSFDRPNGLLTRSYGRTFPESQDGGRMNVDDFAQASHKESLSSVRCSFFD